jgi:hypothetical protein
MKWAGINPLQRRMMEQGLISPRAWRREAKARGLRCLGLPADAADNSGVAGAVGVNAINRGNGKKWPSVSAVKASNNRTPRRSAPENSQTYGNWYSGRSGRP